MSLREFSRDAMLGSRAIGYYWIRRRVNRTEEPLILFFHGFHTPSRPTEIERAGHWSYSPESSLPNRFTGIEFGITYIDQYLGRRAYRCGDDYFDPAGVILELPL